MRALLVVLLAAGCNQSLFSAQGHDAPGGDGGVDGAVPTSCPAGCIADAAGDYDGSARGSTGRWRYLDDHRDRTWAAMTAGTDGMTGADPANAITTCAARPDAAACAALPGALLVSTAGASAAADPALEVTAPDQQVLQLSLRVHVPAGSVAQSVRLYRNSREDVLVAELAAPGTTFEQALEVDALPGDRFLLALAPNALGASDVGVHFYVATTGAAFPSTCQMAVTFDAAVGNLVSNPCGGGGDLTSYMYNQDNSRTPIPPTLAAAPFPELGMAADLAADRFFAGSSALVRAGPTTIQMWAKHDGFVQSYAAFLFSDDDLDNGGGISFDLYDASGTSTIEMATCRDPVTLAFDLANTTWPGTAGWHFVRVVYDGTTVSMCLDGTRVATMTPTLPQLGSTFPPHVGKNVVWTPAGAYFDGQVDDLRVFSTALPCE